MFKTKGIMFVIVLVGLAVNTASLPAQEAAKSPTGSEQSEREAMYYRYLEFFSLVKGGSIEPHWLTDGSSFWYAEGAPANTVIWKVDLNANSKTRLFDTDRLRAVLRPLLCAKFPEAGLPFEEFSFVGNGDEMVRFAVRGQERHCPSCPWSPRPRTTAPSGSGSRPSVA